MPAVSATWSAPVPSKGACADSAGFLEESEGIGYILASELFAASKLSLFAVGFLTCYA